MASQGKQKGVFSNITNSFINITNLFINVTNLFTYINNSITNKLIPLSLFTDFFSDTMYSWN